MKDISKGLLMGVVGIVAVVAVGEAAAIGYVVSSQGARIERLSARVNQLAENLATVSSKLALRPSDAAAADATGSVTPIAPQNFGIPGTGATVVMPGDWKYEGPDSIYGGAAFIRLPGDNDVVRVKSETIGDGDLQAWFKNAFPAEAATEAIVTGPNQTKVGPLLAIRQDTTYRFVQPDGSPAVIESDVAVRKGGEVLVFRLSSNTKDYPALSPSWDAFLESLSWQ